MAISLSDFIRKAIDRYIDSTGIVGLNIAIDPKKKFVQINNKVYAENNPSTIVEVIEFKVIDWFEEIDQELVKAYSIKISTKAKASKRSEDIVEDNKASKNPQIGIFYYIPKDFSKLTGGKLEYISKDMPKEIVENTKFVSAPYMHIVMWEDIKIKYPQYKNYSYGVIPRGRVIYDIKNMCYLIVTDRCLMTKTIIKEITLRFNISKNNYRVEDEPNHYECHRCSSELELEDYELQ